MNPKTPEERRLELQRLLETMGAKKVYFQPPGSHKLVYPCIIYERARADTRFADNVPYTITRAYSLVVIDSNPDSKIVTAVMSLPKCSHERHFVSDNLHHDAFVIYY